MIYRNEDRFTKLLSDCVEEKYQKLKGKVISVDLSIEEIGLIDEALHDYSWAVFSKKINETLQDYSNINDKFFQEIRAAVKDGFAEIQSHEIVFERLRSKLNEAKDNALNCEEKQSGFKFGLNGNDHN